MAAGSVKEQSSRNRMGRWTPACEEEVEQNVPKDVLLHDLGPKMTARPSWLGERIVETNKVCVNKVCYLMWEA